MLASEVLFVETEKIPHPKRRRFALNVLGLAVRSIETNPAIESRARAYNKMGLFALDALHLASAVEADADVFCTNDDQLLRRGQAGDTKGTAVLTPIELIERIET